MVGSTSVGKLGSIRRCWISKSCKGLYVGGIFLLKRVIKTVMTSECSVAWFIAHLAKRTKGGATGRMIRTTSTG
jgi:hypothetical protein